MILEDSPGFILEDLAGVLGISKGLSFAEDNPKKDVGFVIPEDSAGSVILEDSHATDGTVFFKCICIYVCHRSHLLWSRNRVSLWYLFSCITPWRPSRLKTPHCKVQLQEHLVRRTYYKRYKY